MISRDARLDGRVWNRELHGGNALALDGDCFGDSFVGMRCAGDLVVSFK